LVEKRTNQTLPEPPESGRKGDGKDEKNGPTGGDSAIPAGDWEGKMEIQAK